MRLEGANNMHPLRWGGTNGKDLLILSNVRVLKPETANYSIDFFGKDQTSGTD